MRSQTSAGEKPPLEVELNDIARTIQHHKACELYDRGMAQFERLYAESIEDARITAIAVHPYISGVPHRIGHFARLLETLRSKPGVAFWTGDRILDWHRGTAARSPG